MNTTEALESVLQAAAAHERLHPTKQGSRALALWQKRAAKMRARLDRLRTIRAEQKAAAETAERWVVTGLLEHGSCTGIYDGPREAALAAARREHPEANFWTACPH